jgi:hypothetical protein
VHFSLPACRFLGKQEINEAVRWGCLTAVVAVLSVRGSGTVSQCGLHSLFESTPKCTEFSGRLVRDQFHRMLHPEELVKAVS